MAESLLLPVLRGVLGKAADALVQSVTRMWGVDDDRLELESMLLYVQPLLADAEVKAEVESEAGRAVKAWMKKLKAAACQADDVLDYFQYEALRREAQSHRSMPSKVLAYFTSQNQLVFRHKASRDLKSVLGTIDKLVKDMNKFGLLQRALEAPQVLYRQTHSALDESAEIFGRDDDKEVVVKLLLDQQDQHDVQVLPIVGMGGLGKTTLAKMVYNDCRVQKHFESKMWHCVSESFEATALVRSVIELATNKTCDLPVNIELLRGRLQEAIGRKRFLLILDDVWNEEQHKWEDDLKPLLCSSIGGSGSMIVVTSRSPKVASIMGTLPPHELVCLSEDDSWQLFSKKAFGKGVQEQAQLVTIGRRIVNKCKGLPLALKTMGGLMSSKQQVQEWEAIADCNISDTSRGKDEVMSILKLSYRHLSPEMKQCFAFCAVFPKDYEMEKHKLIQLWMANGFILQEGTMDLTQKGEFVYNELAWRSFLQDANVKVLYVHGTSYEEMTCKMHDLMHDLARDVTDEYASAQELSQQKASIKDVRHVQLSSDELKEIGGLLKGMSSLCTLLVRSELSLRTLFVRSEHKDLDELKLMSLRALCCERSSSIIHSQLIKTAHLRYLDLSGSDIVRLPNSVCMMYNLQSLRLNYCGRLLYLPEGIATMRKLSHIYLLECYSLKRMPPNLSLLHNLHTLTTFVVDTRDGCRIEELKDMRQLGNVLELFDLRKVKSGSEANLHEKKNLNELQLHWGRNQSYIPTNDEVSDNEEQVLESLVPHDELKKFGLHGYSGLAFPQWMREPEMFLFIRELFISHCPRCKDLPIIWLASSLEKLRLERMNSLTTLWKNIDVEAAGYNTSLQIFQKLKRMELLYLPKLGRWAENSAGEPNSLVMFPQLEVLNIRLCPKLASLPESPILTRLTCDNESAGGLVPLSIPLGSWPSLVHLGVGMLADMLIPLEDQQSQSQRPLHTLRSLDLLNDDGFASMFNLSKLQPGLRDCLAFVERLKISLCHNIVRWPLEELRCLPRLRSLRISGCDKLEGEGSSSEEEEILPLPQLEKLQILFCSSLLEIPKLPAALEDLEIEYCRGLASLPSNLGNLAKLRRLYLSSCDGLKALPDGMDGLTSLERLVIYKCPGIDKFPQGLLQRLPALKLLRILGCPDLQRRCRQGGEYFDLVSTIPETDIPATDIPATEFNVKKFVKKLLPPC